MPLTYIAMTAERAGSLRAGATDANGQFAETSISDGDGNPCRHCLSEIALGQRMLILAHRPFESLQAYAETGPVFLCADKCERHPETAGLPRLYQQREMLIRGYDSSERIVYGSGRVIDMKNIDIEANALFEDPTIVFIHVRSPTNNCYHFRIEKSPE